MRAMRKSVRRWRYVEPRSDCEHQMVLAMSSWSRGRWRGERISNPTFSDSPEAGPVLSYHRDQPQDRSYGPAGLRLSGKA
jgi:hypothetical protein